MTTSSTTEVPSASTTSVGLPLSPLALRELLSRKQDANLQLAVCADMDVRDTGSFPVTRYSRTLLDQWRQLDAALSARLDAALSARLTPEVHQ